MKLKPKADTNFKKREELIVFSTLSNKIVTKIKNGAYTHVSVVFS